MVEQMATNNCHVVLWNYIFGRWNVRWVIQTGYVRMTNFFAQNGWFLALKQREPLKGHATMNYTANAT